MAQRTRRTTKARAIPAAVIELGEAIKFVSCAQRDIGQPYQSHVKLGDLWAIAYDGILAAGCAIPEELNCCPHTAKLLEALSKSTGETVSITLSDGRLAVKSGNLRVFIPCALPDLMPVVIPDPVCGLVDDRLRDGFEKVMRIASDTAEHVLTASILLQRNSMLATDRIVILEYWHGIDLPRLVLPKKSVKAFVDCKKSMIKFGFSETSFTIYFQDNSWIKTQLYNENWPDSAFRILDGADTQFRPLPPNFFDAVAAVAPHSEGNRIYLLDGAISSHEDGLEIGARMTLPGCVGGWSLSATKLMLMHGLMTHGDFGMDEPRAVYFQGDNIRGAIAAYGEK